MKTPKVSHRCPLPCDTDSSSSMSAMHVSPPPVLSVCVRDTSVRPSPPLASPSADDDGDLDVQFCLSGTDSYGKSQMSAVVLRNGVRMPQVGLGTYQMNESDLTIAIPASLDCGYRSFDTAASYRNEKFLGDILERELAVRGLQRSDIFITSKLKPADHGTANAMEAIKRSAQLLGGYIDLYLIHWPGVSKKLPDDLIHSVKRTESWTALQDALEDGKLVRAIGVSNYNVSHLQDLLCNPACYIFPMVNQVELHPAHHPADLISYCLENDIHLQAYSSLGQGKLLSEEFTTSFPGLLSIAKKHFGMSSQDSPQTELASLYLRWAIQMGFSIIPKSICPRRISDNFVACTFTHDDMIDTVDMAYISGMQVEIPRKFCWDSSVVL